MNNKETGKGMSNVCRISDVRDITGEFTLPDYIPDVRKVAWYSAEPYISRKYLNSSDNSFEYEGETLWTMLLLGEDDSIKSAVFSTDLNGSIKLPDGFNTDNLTYWTDTESDNLRLTDQRTLGARIRLSVNLASFNDTVCPIGQISENDGDIQRYTDNTECLYGVSGENDSYRISEDISLDGNTPEIGEIILCSVQPLINDIKPMDGKAVIRGTANVSLLYKTPVGDTAFFAKALPLSEMIDVEGCTEDMCCTVVCRSHDINAVPSMNSFGENRVLQLDFGWSAKLDGFRNIEVSVIRDMYSVGYESRCGFGECELSVLDFCRSDAVSGKLSVPISEAGISENSVVSGVFGEAVCDGVEYIADKGNISVSGRAVLKVLTEGYGGTGTPSVSTVEIPFVREYEYKGSGVFRDICDMTLLRGSAEISGDMLNAEADVFLSAVGFSDNRQSCVLDITVDKEKPFECRKNQIILCYPSHNETTWDIAKKYHTTQNALQRSGTDEGYIMIVRNDSEPLTFDISG